jgi:alpha-1,3-rhamnosyl/mannosyltransferase
MLIHDLVPKHFPEYQENLRQRLYYRAIERACASVDHFITPSESTKHDLEEFLAIPATQISVAPLGVSDLFRTSLDSSVRDDILRRYGLEPGYLYHGGGLERRKNTETLLRAYASLSGGVTGTRLLPPLVISGKVYPETNPLATPVRSLVSALGLDRQVRLLGCVPESDLPALYQGASMFIYPSRFEGFGLPVLEAFASGTPVVTTVAGSLAELTEDAAVIVSPDDVMALAQAIRSLSGDDLARRVLGAKGKERSTQYSWSRFAQTIVSTLLQ